MQRDRKIKTKRNKDRERKDIQNREKQRQKERGREREAKRERERKARGRSRTSDRFLEHNPTKSDQISRRSDIELFGTSSHFKERTSHKLTGLNQIRFSTAQTFVELLETSSYLKNRIP
jgi:hypothetical protein